MNGERRDDDTQELVDKLEREFGQRRDELAGWTPPPDWESPASPRQGVRRTANAPRGRPRPMTNDQRPTTHDEPRGRGGWRRRPGAPRVVYAIIAINVLMYAVTWFLTYLNGNSDRAFTLVLYALGAKEGYAIDAGQYWRFLTPIVLHGGLIHLGVNSYSLYVLGPTTERFYGSLRFLAIYLLAGFAGSLASYLRSPGLSIGASGAIFGLVGALAAFFYSARSVIGGEAAQQQIKQLIAMAAINIVIGLSVQVVDNAAHLGGLAAGAVAGYTLAPRYRVDREGAGGTPIVVRTDRPTTSWLLAGLILAGLVAIAAASVGRYGQG